MREYYKGVGDPRRDLMEATEKQSTGSMCAGDYCYTVVVAVLSMLLHTAQRTLGAVLRRNLTGATRHNRSHQSPAVRRWTEGRSVRPNNKEGNKASEQKESVPSKYSDCSFF